MLAYKLAKPRKVQDNDYVPQEILSPIEWYKKIAQETGKEDNENDKYMESIVKRRKE